MVAFFIYLSLSLGIFVFAISNAETLEWFWEMSFLGNTLLLGVASLLSFLAYQREHHYRHVFFALWVVFGVYAFASPVAAVVQVLGSPEAGIRQFIWYPFIAVHTVLAWAVTTITIGYISPPRKRLLHTAIAGLVVFIMAGWLYYPYIFDPLAAVSQNAQGTPYLNIDPLNTSNLMINVFSLLMLLAFYVHKYRTDRPIGAYADTLLFLFGLALAIDTAESFLPDLKLDFTVISQWAILIVYAAMVVSLALRIKFKSQTIADYYESQCISDDPSIDRRIGRFDRFILRTFFDTEKIGSKIFLGTGTARMKVRRTPSHVARRAGS